ncbi:ABC transporter permease [Paenibacillus sp. GCM10023250]|uniref:ABC transporter permease n=1 Tax=Paenibacillus sp. GCM10023250 TaxID=3252648 RepID=UPI00361B0871
MNLNTEITRPRRSFGRKVIKNRYLLLMMLPGTIYLLVNNYLPMFGTVIAFKSVDWSKGIFHSPWVGFDNFKFLFRTSDAWTITRNTLLYNALFITITPIIAVTFAILLNEVRARLAARFYQSVMFLPYFLSAVVVGYLGYSLLSTEFGFINSHVLEPLGFDAIAWYSEAKYWPYILPLVYIWKNIGYSTVIYLAAVIGIDNEYYEAALMDGASKWRQAISITLPQIKPIIIILTLMAVGHILNADFGLFYQVPLDAGALYPTTNVIDTYVYRALLTLGDVGMSSAAGLYQSAVGFVLVLSVNFIVRRINKENALF